MCLTRQTSKTYEENKRICKYVHSTSRGHEAIQLGAAYHLLPTDFASPYYRDESILLGIGCKPYELMLQLLAKRDDPFSGGKSYYSHPSLKREGFPTIPHQSSATGMQVIPATGMAHGISYLENRNLLENNDDKPVVLCSLGDGAITEGEVSEAMQMAVLKKLPIIYLVQDNDWSISVSKEEFAAMDAYEFAAGFKGMKRYRINGSDFKECYEEMGKVFDYVRKKRGPALVHAKVPLLGHHTSGVRKEYYRDDEDLTKHSKKDPIPVLEKELKKQGISEEELQEINEEAINEVNESFQKAIEAPEPDPETIEEHVYAPTPVTEEKGVRKPADGKNIMMVDAGLHAIKESMEKDERMILYGQDVGKRLGGVFREAATLGDKFGDDRVFNTPIQEAYIVGSTVGMAAVGVKAVVEVQFADYIWPGINQLVVEHSKSNYLSQGKFPTQAILRVPCGAYGGGGPYHSDCVESSILPIKGLKVGYPSNAADMKGLMKAAYKDPNMVVMFEHKGLYWGIVPGSEGSRQPEPDEDYIVPFGKARMVKEANPKKVENGESLVIITYGAGVYWSSNAAENFDGCVSVMDLRSLQPLDEEMIYSEVKKHNRAMVVTEEQLQNSFAQALAGKISKECFEYLDAPVEQVGSLNIPAIATNEGLEKAFLPNKEKVTEKIREILSY